MMKSLMNILSGMLASALVAGVFICGTGCGKNPGGTTGNTKPPVQSVTQQPDVTRRPNGIGSLNGDYGNNEAIEENWGIDANKVVFSVNYNGEEHTYTAGKLYSLGMDRIKATNVDEKESVLKIMTFSGIKLGKVFTDMGLDAADLDLSRMTLANADGSTLDITDKIPNTDIGECVIAFTKSGRAVDGNSGAYFVWKSIEVDMIPVANSGITGLIIE